MVPFSRHLLTVTESMVPFSHHLLTVTGSMVPFSHHLLTVTGSMVPFSRYPLTVTVDGTIQPSPTYSDSRWYHSLFTYFRLKCTQSVNLKHLHLSGQVVKRRSRQSQKDTSSTTLCTVRIFGCAHKITESDN